MDILDFWFRGDCVLRKRVLLLTGNAGVGKTTVVTKVINTLKAKGFSIGGMISHEVRKGGTRVGFEILDVSTGRCGWLAHINQEAGPQVGKYRVNMNDLDLIGAKAVLDALEKCDVVAIDEVGPMELFSEKFNEAVQKALESRKPVLAVVHWKAMDRLIGEANSREDVETFTVTHENREWLPDKIVEKNFSTKKREKPIF